MYKKLFFVDVETTGTNSEVNGIWQLSYIIEINGKVKYKKNLYMNPGGVQIDGGALQHSNINKHQLKEFPPQKKQFKKFKKVLDKVVDRYNRNDKLQLVAYNANFDKDFLRAWFLRNNDNWYDTYFFGNNLCTYNLASIICMNIRYRMINFRLETVAKLFKIDLENAHDAEADNEANYKLYHKLLKHIKLIEV